MRHGLPSYARSWRESWWPSPDHVGSSHREDIAYEDRKNCKAKEFVITDKDGKAMAAGNMKDEKKKKTTPRLRKETSVIDNLKRSKKS